MAMAMATIASVDYRLTQTDGKRLCCKDLRATSSCGFGPVRSYQPLWLRQSLQQSPDGYGLRAMLMPIHL